MAVPDTFAWLVWLATVTVLVMVQVNVADVAVSASESVAVTVTEQAQAVVGVPVTAPVERVDRETGRQAGGGRRSPVAAGRVVGGGDGQRWRWPSPTRWTGCPGW